MSTEVGEAFNVGETFAGLPLAKGIELAERLMAFVPEGMTMAQFSQRWILDHDAVSTVITGASQPSQVADNAAVSEQPPLSKEVHRQLALIYGSSIKEHIRGLY
jgi:aryl-alcohol dehydrogenase-like predicted oxidoreductase